MHERSEHVLSMYKKSKGDVQALSEHLCSESDEYVIHFFRELIPAVESQHGCLRCVELLRMFIDLFVVRRKFAAVSEVLREGVELLGRKREAEGCIWMVEHLENIYEEKKAAVKESGTLDGFVEAFTRVGVLLSEVDALHESYRACTRACDAILFAGEPPSPEVSAAYLELLCHLFIRSSMLYSYLNAVNLLTALDLQAARRQCSLSDLKLLVKYLEFKNEGDAFERLFCNARLVSPRDILRSLGEKLSDCGETLVRRWFSFEKWDLVVENRMLESSPDLVSFLLKNDIGYEVEGKMLRIGRYEYKPIGRKIFEIVDSYEERVEAREKHIIEKIQSVELTPVKIQKEKPRRALRFADKFTLPYKQLIVCLRYAGAVRRTEDFGYGERNDAARAAFEKKQDGQQRMQDDLAGYKELVDELRTGLEEKMRARASRRVAEERVAEEGRMPQPSESFFGGFKQERLAARDVPVSLAGKYVPPNLRESREGDHWGRAERQAARSKERGEKEKED
jgi:Arc/MetJ-type ribon-helix-helix transcriptional regulator